MSMYMRDRHEWGTQSDNELFVNDCMGYPIGLRGMLLQSLSKIVVQPAYIGVF